MGAPELSIREDEAGEIVQAIEGFAEAWFPDSDGIALPPRLTSAMALIAVLYGSLQPRVVALRAKSRAVAANRSQAATGEQWVGADSTVQPPFDTSLLQPLA